MCKQKFSVVCAFLNYIRSHILSPNGNSTMPILAETCPKLVDSLRQAGADILRYSHRGVVSTVVNF